LSLPFNPDGWHRGKAQPSQARLITEVCQAARRIVTPVWLDVELKD